VQDKLYKDFKDERAIKELPYTPELGEKIRNIFQRDEV
jgi:hypothetical protein